MLPPYCIAGLLESDPDKVGGGLLLFGDGLQSLDISKSLDLL